MVGAAKTLFDGALSSTPRRASLPRLSSMVKAEMVWRAGLRLRFHPALIATLLESVALARALSFQGAVTDPARARRHV